MSRFSSRFSWSSYVVQRLDPVPLWAESRKTEAGRQAYWRQRPHTPLSEREQVRPSISSGRPYGAEAWAAKTAQRLGVDVEPGPCGRRRKPPENMN